MDKQKILKVLDMNEDEQWEWLEDNGYIDWNKACFCKSYEYTYIFNKKGTLADLAFRLRDEVDNKLWITGTQAVFTHLLPGYSNNVYSVATYFSDTAKSIYWILAALIAKEN